MSTIADVAQHAGVSVSTVSNLLNGRTDRMRADTSQRIEAAIRALGYRPNRAAQQLKTGHTPMLGLLVPSIANPMYGYIAREIETSAQERHGHRVLLGNTYRNKDKETGFFDDLLDHGVRGVHRHLLAGGRAAFRIGGAARAGDGQLRPPRHAGRGLGDRPRVGRQLRGGAPGHRAPDRPWPPAPGLRHRVGPDHEPCREDEGLLRRGRDRGPARAAPA